MIRLPTGRWISMSRLLSTKCVANSIITGIVNSVIMLLHAVSDTDNATSPLAIMEKMLDELPPGEQAMSMNRGSSWKTCPKANASIGSRMIWPASPAIMGRGRLRNSLKSSVCNVSPSSNINKVRMGRTIHIAFISQIIFEAAKIANIVVYFAILSAFVCQTISLFVWHGFRKLFIACLKQNYHYNKCITYKTKRL